MGSGNKVRWARAVVGWIDTFEFLLTWDDEVWKTPADSVSVGVSIWFPGILSLGQ